MPTKVTIECKKCGTVEFCSLMWPEEVKELLVHCPICDDANTYPVISAELFPKMFEAVIIKPKEKYSYGKTKKDKSTS
jgi:uncharacterized Zn finger protein